MALCLLILTCPAYADDAELAALQREQNGLLTQHNALLQGISFQLNCLDATLGAPGKNEYATTRAHFTKVFGANTDLKVLDKLAKDAVVAANKFDACPAP